MGWLDRFRGWRYDRHRRAAEAAAEAERSDAVEHHLRAASRIAEGFGNGDPRTVDSLEALARFLHDAGRDDDTRELFDRILSLEEQRLGEGAALAARLNEIALFHRMRHRHAEAEALHRRALGFLEGACAADDPRIAQCLDGLAASVFRQKRWPEAEELYRRLLTLEEEAHGPDSLELASTLNRLAKVYRSQFRNREAMELEERVVALRERAAKA